MRKQYLQRSETKEPWQVAVLQLWTQPSSRIGLPLPRSCQVSIILSKTYTRALPYITHPLGSSTEQENLRSGKAESEETRIPFPLLPLTRCSGRHRCYPRRAAQPLIPLLPLPRYTGDGGWEPKWWWCSGGDSRRTRPSPSQALTAPQLLKCPIRCNLIANAVSPRAFQGYQQRRAGEGTGEGAGAGCDCEEYGGRSPRENTRGPPHSSLHRFVFRHFPITPNHRRPPRRLLSPGAVASGKKRSAEGEIILSIPPAIRCCGRQTVCPRGRERLGTRRHFHCSLCPTVRAGCEPLLPSREQQ